MKGTNIQNIYLLIWAETSGHVYVYLQLYTNITIVYYKVINNTAHIYNGIHEYTYFIHWPFVQTMKAVGEIMPFVDGLPWVPQ